MGTRRGIELGSVNDDIYLNDKPIKLPLKYNTTDEEHPNTYCTWEVTPIDDKEPVKTGNLNTADPTIDLTSLPSGQYNLKIHTNWLTLPIIDDSVDMSTLRLEFSMMRGNNNSTPSVAYSARLVVCAAFETAA